MFSKMTIGSSMLKSLITIFGDVKTKSEKKTLLK